MAGEALSWERYDELRTFSGTGVYTCRFDATAEMVSSPAAVLRLSHLSAAARVRVNGVPAGEIWTRPLSVSLAGALREGENVVEIEVSSTLVNEMMSRPNGGAHEPVPERLEHWPYYGTVINVHRRARLNTVREATECREPMVSGVWGEVVLEF